MAVSSPPPRRPSTLAVVVGAGVSTYLPRTLAALAGQTHHPDVVVVVDVSAAGRDVGTGVPVHEAVADSGLDRLTPVRVVRAPEAATFGEAVRQGLGAYADLVERAELKARRRGAVGTLVGSGSRRTTGSWSGVTGELSPVTTGEIRAVGVGGADPDDSARAEWLWLLHDDSAPAPDALDRLLHAAESARSVAVAGAKQRDWAEPDRLLEVGVQATRTARRVPDVEPGEIDQGQHDHREDVLAVGLAGALVRTEIWEELGGTDPVLGPFGDGLELCRRVRLAGHRVVVVPGAVVHHARAGYLGLRPTTADEAAATPAAPDPRRSFLARRRAQVHNALVAAPGLLVPLLVVGYLLLAPLRALWRVTTKEIGLVGAEIAAVLGALGRPGAVWRARRRTARTRRIPARSLTPLLAGAGEIRAARRDVRRQAAATRRAAQAPSELEMAERAALARRRRTTAAATLLTLTVLAAVGLGHLALAGPLTGGALVPVDGTLGDLWHAARAGWVAEGDGQPGPADPLLQVLAVPMLALAPFGASTSVLMTALVVLALPLAGAGAWCAAGAATRSTALRAWAAVLWALAPTLLLATGQGRLGALVAHLALPWAALGVARFVGVDRRDTILSGLVGARRTALARAAQTRLDAEGRPTPVTGPAPGAAATPPAGRSGSVAAGAGAALALAVAAAGAPVLLPAAVVLCAVLALAVPRRRLAVLALPVPALVLLGPLVVAAFSAPGGWRLLLAGPGPALGADAGPAWLGVLGWPAAPPRVELLAPAGEQVAELAMLAAGAALALVAVVALLRGGGRARAVRAGWLVAVVGLAAAVVAAHVDVAVGTGPDGAAAVVRGWAGPGTSLVVLGLLVAVLAAGDGLRASLAGHSFGWRQAAAAVLATVMILGPLVTAAGWVTGVRADADRPGKLLLVHGRDHRPLPAVAREMQDSSARSRVLALTPAPDGVRARVWRGPGPQLTTTPAVAGVRELPDGGSPDAATTELAGAVAALSVGAGEDLATVLARHAVGIVLVEPGETATPADREALVTRLDATSALSRVTENESGVVWRVARAGADGVESVARARVLNPDGSWAGDVPAGKVSVAAELPSGEEGRLLVLAERGDAGWWATYDGRALRTVDHGWQQAFVLPAHTGSLRVGYDAPGEVAWPWVQGVVLGLTVLLALPVRRRRTEVL